MSNLNGSIQGILPGMENDRSHYRIVRLGNILARLKDEGQPYHIVEELEAEYVDLAIEHRVHTWTNRRVLERMADHLRGAGTVLEQGMAGHIDRVLDRSQRPPVRMEAFKTLLGISARDVSGYWLESVWNDIKKLSIDMVLEQGIPPSGLVHRVLDVIEVPEWETP